MENSKLTEYLNKSIMGVRNKQNNMVEADFSGNFLNTENAKEGDVIEITGEGSYEDKDWGKVLNVPVKCNELEKIYSPSRETGKKFIAAWGSNTTEWIGKKASVKHVNYKSFGESKIGLECEPVAE
tara:strand:+ start:582 stop:959 length:378 start_codon:yes stop_codon:yes gene_type:complete